MLIWNDAVYGWKNCLRDPQHEDLVRIAIDSSEHIFIAEVVTSMMVRSVGLFGK